MIPYGLLIKIGIGLLSVFLLISGVKTTGTLWDNMWTKYDNKMKVEMAAAQNMSYAKGVAEEKAKGLDNIKQLYADMDAERKVFSKERLNIEAAYQKNINRDITGKLKELESDHEVFNEKSKRASLRELDKKRQLSDLSTVTE